MLKKTGQNLNYDKKQLALDSESQQISATIKHRSIDVALILEVLLRLFPVDEFEILININKLLIADCDNANGYNAKNRVY